VKREQQIEIKIVCPRAKLRPFPAGFWRRCKFHLQTLLTTTLLTGANRHTIKSIKLVRCQTTRSVNHPLQHIEIEESVELSLKERAECNNVTEQFAHFNGGGGGLAWGFVYASLFVRSPSAKVFNLQTK
jgi:hypothetical protein